MFTLHNRTVSLNVNFWRHINWKRNIQFINSEINNDDNLNPKCMYLNKTITVRYSTKLIHTVHNSDINAYNTI